MQKEVFICLVDKCLKGEASTEELRLLEEHYMRMGRKGLGVLDAVKADELKKELWAEIADRIQGSGQMGIVKPVHRVHFVKRRWSMAAAMIVLIVGSVWMLLLDKTERGSVVAKKQEEILPGKNGAVLVAADGRKYVFENKVDGKLTAQGGRLRLIGKDGAVTYLGNSPTGINTFSTPRARQNDFVLPDGTRVWLNAESSITYPTVFANNERKVKITGEVYFEVKHDAKKPFRVDAAGQMIEDLGTAFNVHAYDNNPVATTLVEGIVKVNGSQLKPGEQYKNGVIKEADIDQAIAWKNGMFAFGENADVKTVMEIIGRWYDVEIKYEGLVPNRSFGGKIDRNLPLSNVLRILEQQKVKFEVIDRTIIVKE